MDTSKYVRYTPEQVEALERVYTECPKPSSLRRQQLIRECPILSNIEPKQIKVWFQNRRCREKQRKEASRLQTVNRKLTAMNKLLMEENDRLQKQVSHLVYENGYMKQQLHSASGTTTDNSCESVVMSGQPQQQQNPTAQHPQRDANNPAGLLAIAEEALAEFLSKATGTAVDWVQMIGMKPGPDSIGIVAVSRNCSGVAARACGLVSLEPTKVAEILKDRPSWFRDCRCLDVLSVIPTGSGGTIELIYMQTYAPTTLAAARDFWTLRYTTSLEDGSLVMCERSLTSSTGGPAGPPNTSFVRAEMLPSGYLIRPCEGGGSIIHIVDHVDLDAWSVPEVLRPLYESSKILAQKMTIAALRHIRQIAQETSGEIQYGGGRQPAVLRTFSQRLCRGFNDAVNGFADDGWSLMSSDGVEDVTIMINSSPTKFLGSQYGTSMFSTFGGGVLCAKASMLLQNVPPALLVRFLREHRSEWADYGVDAYSAACLKASPYSSGKSHTMFGCSKQPGIVYRSLKDILGDGEEGSDANDVRGTFVQVTVLEIYNEEIFDLLSSNGGGGLGIGWPKGSASKVKLEVMGKKAKNASYISGNEAGKISKEIQKVEKRRIVKSTLCNDRSSRSHCLIILDVPTVGGRLMLVDMAGSENIEQAGQIGFEAKMQTAKINQGNTALKRVVESIANGDSHVPFRDSKLTMLLQDSFEDDKSKILMILCASPDPKEIHKTISTLEYGAKAKCIVRGPHTPNKDKIGTEDSSSAVILGSRIAAMDEFIFKLQRENKLREKERNEAHKELLKKEEEVAALRARLELIEGRGSGASEEEINLKVNERAQILKRELEKRLEECQKMTNEFVELERRRMEERILQQQQEVEMLRQRLEEIELELCRSKDASADESALKDMDGSGFAKRLMRIYSNEDPGMVKSMDLDMDDQEPIVREVKHVGGIVQGILDQSHLVDHDVFASKFGDRVCLSTVFEEEEVEEGEDEREERMLDEEVEKEIIEEKRVCVVDQCSPVIRVEQTPNPPSRSPRKKDHLKDRLEDRLMGSELISEPENSRDTASSRRLRIQNIFTLCGNHRELSQHIRTPTPAKKRSGTIDPQSSPVMKIGEDSIVNNFNKENLEVQKFESESPAATVEPLASVKEANEKKLTESQLNKKQVFSAVALSLKENYNPYDVNDAKIEVYVKWEASKEIPGKFITTLKVVKDASLADLRKLIEISLGADSQAFTFVVLGDPNGAPVPREKEGMVQAIKLPLCNNQANGGRLACLRPAKGIQCPTHLPPSPLPLRPLENKLPLTPTSCFSHPVDGLSPNYSSTPFITVRKHQLEQL